MGKCYKNSPILEALCEFRFQPDPNWDYTIPGRFYERVQAQFPDRKQESLVAVEMEPHEGGLHQRVKSPGIKMRFRRADGSALLQVAPNLLAVNQLKPYPDWTQFKSMILEAYSTYLQIGKPTGIERMGLRYINQIEIPDKEFDFERFFRVYPHFPAGYPESYGNLVVRAEFPFAAERETLILILASVRASANEGVRFVLDFDYGSSSFSDTIPEQIAEFLERAHTRIEEVFEASITDETRRLFGEQT